MKKKMMLALSCLMLAAVILLTGRPTAVQAANSDYSYKCLNLSVYDSDNRAKLGTKYLWTVKDSSKTVIRCSASKTGTGFTAASIACSSMDTFVSNGSILYYVTPSGNLYKSDLETKTRAKIADLASTMKTRLGSDSVSITPLAAYGSVVYLYVDGDEKAAIYAYYTKTAGLKRIASGSITASASSGRYFTFSRASTKTTADGGIQIDLTTYQYNMKEGTTTKVCQALGSAYFNNKLYVFNYINSTGTYNVREYDPVTLSYRTIRTLEIEDRYLYLPLVCYNNAIYYIKADMQGKYANKIYRLNINTCLQSSINEDAIDGIYKKASPGAFFGF